MMDRGTCAMGGRRQHGRSGDVGEGVPGALDTLDVLLLEQMVDGLRMSKVSNIHRHYANYDSPS